MLVIGGVCVGLGLLIAVGAAVAASASGPAPGRADPRGASAAVGRLAGAADGPAGVLWAGSPEAGVAGVAGPVGAHSGSLAARAVEPIVVLGGRLVARLSPAGRLELLRSRIVQAGWEGRVTPERVYGYKAVGAVGGLVLGLLVHPGLPFWLWSVFFAVVGFFLPDGIVANRAGNRQKLIARELPEALDLLAITVEAGLGLEQAMEVVAGNLSGPLGGEFLRLLREMGLGVSRRDALVALRSRVAVPELSAFVAALVQADQLGVAVGEVLKVQAAQVRLKRRQRAREQAGKTPVKILFPVIFGILPALFVVTVGPAAINIFHSFVHRL